MSNIIEYYAMSNLNHKILVKLFYLMLDYFIIFYIMKYTQKKTNPSYEQYN